MSKIRHVRLDRPDKSKKNQSVQINVKKLDFLDIQIRCNLTVSKQKFEV